MDHIECDNTKLESCRSWKLGGGNCRHEDDLFLTCTDDLEEEIDLLETDSDRIVIDGTCISDSRFHRVLLGPKDVYPEVMDIELCRQFCSDMEQKYFGLEDGEQCYCGNKVQYYDIRPRSECNMPCKGTSADICGGYNRMNIYNTVFNEE